MKILEEALRILGVPESARSVYADLLENGQSLARSIATRLGMTRPSVYDQLKILEEKGLIVERDIDGKSEFSIRDLADLERLLAIEEEHVVGVKKEFSKAKATLARRKSSSDPKIRFVSGREAIVRAMHDMLWDDHLILKAVWPYNEMIRALGKRELSNFNEKRIRNGLRLQTIWSPPPKKTDEHLFRFGDEGVERRYAPKGFATRMAYTIYGDKVLFVSSAAESYGFIVQSADFAMLSTLQFDLLWKQSKRYVEKV